jgi:hypothetical protein
MSRHTHLDIPLLVSVQDAAALTAIPYQRALATLSAAADDGAAACVRLPRGQSRLFGFKPAVKYAVDPLRFDHLVAAAPTPGPCDVDGPRFDAHGSPAAWPKITWPLLRRIATVLRCETLATGHAAYALAAALRRCDPDAWSAGDAVLLASAVKTLPQPLQGLSYAQEFRELVETRGDAVDFGGILLRAAWLVDDIAPTESRVLCHRATLAWIAAQQRRGAPDAEIQGRLHAWTGGALNQWSRAPSLSPTPLRSPIDVLLEQRSAFLLECLSKRVKPVAATFALRTQGDAVTEADVLAATAALIQRDPAVAGSSLQRDPAVAGSSLQRDQRDSGTPESSLGATAANAKGGVETPPEASAPEKCSHDDGGEALRLQARVTWLDTIKLRLEGLGWIVRYGVQSAGVTYPLVAVSTLDGRSRVLLVDLVSPRAPSVQPVALDVGVVAIDQHTAAIETLQLTLTQTSTDETGGADTPVVMVLVCVEPPGFFEEDLAQAWIPVWDAAGVLVVSDRPHSSIVPIEAIVPPVEAAPAWLEHWLTDQKTKALATAVKSDFDRILADNPELAEELEDTTNSLLKEASDAAAWAFEASVRIETIGWTADIDWVDCVVAATRPGVAIAFVRWVPRTDATDLGLDLARLHTLEARLAEAHAGSTVWSFYTLDGPETLPIEAYTSLLAGDHPALQTIEQRLFTLQDRFAPATGASSAPVREEIPMPESDTAEPVMIVHFDPPTGDTMPPGVERSSADEMAPRASAAHYCELLAELARLDREAIPVWDPEVDAEPVLCRVAEPDIARQVARFSRIQTLCRALLADPAFIAGGTPAEMAWVVGSLRFARPDEVGLAISARAKVYRALRVRDGATVSAVIAIRDAANDGSDGRPPVDPAGPGTPGWRPWPSVPESPSRTRWSRWAAVVLAFACIGALGAYLGLSIGEWL